MKKILALILSFLIVFSFVGCMQEYTPNISQNAAFGSDSGDSSGGGVDEPEQNEGDDFTVTLKVADGLTMPSLDGVCAVWTSEKDPDIYYKSAFSAQGVASTDRPDGEFYVSISPLPSGYTYEPNLQNLQVDNYNKKVEIPLIALSEMSGKGTSTDDGCYKIKKEGYYRFSFSKNVKQLYFTFSPTLEKGGIYQFRSLVNANDDEIKATFFTHAVQFIAPNESLQLDTAASSQGLFTSNFKVQFNVASSEIGIPRYFSIKMSLKSNANDDSFYPVIIDMELVRIGDVDGGMIPATKFPEECTYDKSKDSQEGEFKFFWNELGHFDQSEIVGSYNKDNIFIPTTRRIKYDSLGVPVDYDTTNYVCLNQGDLTTAPIVYVKISGNIPVSGLTLDLKDARITKTQIINANKDTVDINGDGFPDSDVFNSLGQLKKDGVVDTVLNGGSYLDYILDKYDENGDGLIEVNSLEYNYTTKYIDYSTFFDSYLARANSDGCVPLTVELMKFLYNLSVAKQYFWDGLGTLEGAGAPVTDDESQWMFACGYYK